MEGARETASSLQRLERRASVSSISPGRDLWGEGSTLAQASERTHTHTQVGLSPRAAVVAEAVAGVQGGRGGAAGVQVSVGSSVTDGHAWAPEEPWVAI